MKYKNKKDEFVPWEEEAGKGEAEKPEGIPSITSIKSRVHSKTKSKDQEYLDMYILLREKERLEKYGKTLSKQHRNVAESWRDIKMELLRKEKALPEMSKGEVKEEAITGKKLNKTKKTLGNIKTLDWNY